MPDMINRYSNCKTIEEMHKEHLSKEPVKFRIIDKKYDIKMETEEHIHWRVELESLELVVAIPPAKRQEILAYFRHGGVTIGQTARQFGVDSMAVANLIFFNVDNIPVLRSESI